MKVLSHEAEALKNGFASEVAAIKREYYRICVGLLDDLKRERGLQFSTRIAVLSLFGMMNWIYTWHNPRVDADADATCARDGRYFSARRDGGRQEWRRASDWCDAQRQQIPRFARNDNERMTKHFGMTNIVDRRISVRR